MSIQDWEHWIREINNIEDLSEIERERARIALALLREVFGGDIQEMIRQRHPLLRNLQNGVAWTRKWLIWFAEAIHGIRSKKNSALILDGLRNPSTYRAALSELEVASYLVDAGFEIEFYSSDKTKPNPDLKIVNPETNEEFWVEVSELGDSKQTQEFWNTFNKISNKLFQSATREKHLNFRGRVYKYLSLPSLYRVLSEIDAVIDKAEQLGFAEHYEDGVIELAVAKKDREDALIAWATERGISTSLVGPNLSDDEISRLSNKIDDKVKQLPKNAFNILVIYSSRIFLFYGNIIGIINLIEEHVYKHRRLAFCVITHGILGGGSEERSEHKGGHIYLKKHTYIFNKETLILKNNYVSDNSITVNSAAKIKQAFSQNEKVIWLQGAY